MLQQNYPAEDQKPRWTQTEAIEFECAKETIGHLVSICSFLMAEEKKKAIPNVQRILDLKDKQFKLEQERTALHVDSKEAIERVCQEYGAQIKNYLKKGGPCPV